MKEIKFRAFIDSKMIEWELLKHIYRMHEIFSGKIHYKIMQFTGLLDKNGKEIYEGDIIKRIKKEPSKFHFEIYDPNPTVSEIFYDKAGFFVKGIKGMDFYLGAVHEKVEVIGNIYENPELLEE